MCGIFCSINNCDTNCNNVLNDNNNLDSFILIGHRGPDYSTLNRVDNNVYLGFHRLAIVDQSLNGNQPFELDDSYLVCNGEIYNHEQLISKYNLMPKSKSDCEVILHMYNKFGIDKTVRELDAEFAFILYDTEHKTIYVARDHYGVRPLFIGSKNTELYIASEVKSLHMCNTVEQFRPGHYATIDASNNVTYTKYFDYLELNDHCLELVKYNLRCKLTDAVNKRLMSERPIGCLLSGGLDSSLVTSLVHKQMPDVHCFSIGLEGSVDVAAARVVARHLNITNHHIVTFTVDEGFNVLKDVIYHLESYDITTVRASTPQYLLAKYIKENTDIKVLYSGEGSDEIFAGYQYSKMAPSIKALHEDGKRLLNELHFYDNLRTDRTTAAWGLEVRVPFLDKEFVQYSMSINPEFKMCNNKMEKSVLREAFANSTMLPLEILYRRKEAFSDAVSSKEISWYKTLVSKINELVTDADLENAKYRYKINTPKTKEALYYRNCFVEMYPDRDNLIPHYWMPQWQTTELYDPSATVLACHEGEL